MNKLQPWKEEGLNKAEWVAREVAKAVNAGKAWDLETVDFSDPNRPMTCLEVDFPIIPINQIAAIEGNAGKPIYQMSKWWARRRSSVFRSMLLAAAIKAPDDPSEAAKLVWEVYYGNHQKKGTFKHLKVADIFMGGGTTVVEGSRLGMQMYGNDLNPVAWFVVKNELTQVNKADVEALLAKIEDEVKPQTTPFYACDCPRGHKGKWTQLSTGLEMGDDFDPLSLTHDERKDCLGTQFPDNRFGRFRVRVLRFGMGSSVHFENTRNTEKRVEGSRGEGPRLPCVGGTRPTKSGQGRLLPGIERERQGS